MRTNKENKRNNKGFSLVELIIVIAIMGILVGVVGAQVVPYLEKSREAKDQQVLSSIATAVTASLAFNAETDSAKNGFSNKEFQSIDGGKIDAQVAELLVPSGAGVGVTDYINNQLSSKKVKGKKIYVSYSPKKGVLYVFTSTVAAASFNVDDNGIVVDTSPTGTGTVTKKDDVDVIVESH